MAQILIVDDDPYAGSLFRALCKARGHEAAISTTLAEGLSQIAAKSYDLVLLDVHLPDGNGLDLLPQFRDAASGPMVVILTALGDPQGAELAIKSGAWDYLQKPVSTQELTLTLTRALEYRQVTRRQTATQLLKRDELAGESPELAHCLELMARAAGSDMNVLICGETGSGKEVVASVIHKSSARAARSFVVVDCSSLPENLVETALFGHTKGAFTGANEDQVGLVKKADGGTLFLDEVGELSLAMQKNLLRVLQERCFRPVGSTREVHSDFRLLAATNRNLDEMVAEGKFREDLLFRLKTLQIDVPPLRERKGDLYSLMIYFMKSLNDRYGYGIKGIGPDLLEAVQNYSWPGNVRELKSAIEHAYLASAHFPTLLSNHLPTHIRILLKKESLSENEPAKMDHILSFSMPLSLDEFWAEMQKQYLKILAVSSKGDIQEAMKTSQLSRPRLYSLFKKNGVVLKDK